MSAALPSGYGSYIIKNTPAQSFCRRRSQWVNPDLLKDFSKYLKLENIYVSINHKRVLVPFIMVVEYICSWHYSQLRNRETSNFLNWTRVPSRNHLFSAWGWYSSPQERSQENWHDLTDDWHLFDHQRTDRWRLNNGSEKRLIHSKLKPVLNRTRKKLRWYAARQPTKTMTSLNYGLYRPFLFKHTLIFVQA